MYLQMYIPSARNAHAEQKKKKADFPQVEKPGLRGVNDLSTASQKWIAPNRADLDLRGGDNTPRRRQQLSAGSACRQAYTN